MPAGDAVEETQGEGTPDHELEPVADSEPGERRPPALEDAANLLVLAPTMDESARRAYYEEIVPDRPMGHDVLAVEYRRSPDEWLDEWRRYAGTSPRRAAVVSVDDLTRSTVAATASGSDGVTPVGSNAVVCVERPDDLTGLGIRIHQCLDEFEGPRTVITIDSLTVLLQYVETREAFRFLHVLTNRVAGADAVAHYHMDPAAHDDRTIAILGSLFDAVAEYAGEAAGDEDGTAWAVEER